MNSITRDQFFELLKAGLWVDYTPNVAVFSGSVDWNMIFKLAKEQTVAGVMWDGIQKLPNELFPPKTIKMSWISLVMTIEKVNQHHNSVIVELINLYKDNGIDAVLMKGQSMAANYPNPLRRVCGDIDIYVGEDGYAKLECIKDALNVEWTGESVKHKNFNYKGVTIENHRKFLHEHLSSNSERLKGLVSDWYPNKTCSFVINDTLINIPPLDFNVMFVFSHLYHHFLSSGLGLRQLCDWALLLSKYDMELPDMSTKRSGWELFGYIVVNYLGLPKGKFSDYNDNVRGRVKACLDLIFEDGNFGKNVHKVELGKKPKQYYRGKFHSFKFRVKRFDKLYKVISVNELFSFSKASFITSIKAVLKDRF
ncbi:MAG: nucleotidyltransferase family protein [Bacteroidales bacterium]